MSIEVEVFGALLPRPLRHQVLEAEGPLAVKDVALRLGLAPEAIWLATIDGVQSSVDDVVEQGSRLCLFPPMSGG